MLHQVGSQAANTPISLLSAGGLPDSISAAAQYSGSAVSTESGRHIRDLNAHPLCSLEADWDDEDDSSSEDHVVSTAPCETECYAFLYISHSEGCGQTALASNFCRLAAATPLTLIARNAAVHLLISELPKQLPLARRSLSSTVHPLGRALLALCSSMKTPTSLVIPVYKSLMIAHIHIIRLNMRPYT